MTVIQYSMFVADYSPTFTTRSIVRVERIATKKKPHLVLEAYSERYDADVLIALRIVDWWTLEPVPSIYIPIETFQKVFSPHQIRIDFVP